MTSEGLFNKIAKRISENKEKWEMFYEEIDSRIKQREYQYCSECKVNTTLYSHTFDCSRRGEG